MREIPTIDWRKEKAYLRDHLADPVQSAYYEGQDAGRYERSGVNPYPPGKRHNAWELGYTQNTEH